MMPMFEEMADEIFEQASVNKDACTELWTQTVSILSGKMAMLSSTMGLSIERVNAFNKQKESLVQDLINLKAEHPEIAARRSHKEEETMIVWNQTDIGFQKGDFIDRYNLPCSIQKSSLATEDCIWLGVNGQSRMHLTQKIASELSAVLQHFAETGELPDVDLH
jgi:hypothetical protein